MIFLERTISKSLFDWKEKPGRKPLILRGARQVGKSTLIKHFGKSFDHFISLNLEKVIDLSFFERYKDVTTLFDALALRENIGTSGSILVFIDEIQSYPPAIKLLRYFYEDLPEVHVIAAGSLLEFALKDVSSFPVGRVEQLELHPLSFQEFLMALNEERTIQEFQNIPIKEYAIQILMNAFHRYLVVGGMPEVVAYYIQNKQQFLGIKPIYNDLRASYLEDVEKYAKTNTQRNVIRHVINAAPFVLDRVILGGFGNSNYKAREVREAFNSLGKAKLVKLIYPTTATKIPILPDIKRRPRIQFLDTGLLNNIWGIQSELIGMDDLNTAYQGRIIEHAAHQEMISTSNNIENNLRFWVRENANANAKIDFAIPWSGKIIPIEVKSGASGRLRSLHEFMDRVDHDIAVRLIANNFSIEKIETSKGKEFTLINLPYFLASQIKQYLNWYSHQNN